MIAKRWEVASPAPPQVIQELSGYPPILRQILYNRGYDTHELAQAFLEARPPTGARADSLLNMPAAADRIKFAIQQGEKIAIYGDYDADGVTATALLGMALKQLGAQVSEYIPN
ncbi:MAG: DHH family phosphoesterase, partial [Acidobacteriaceae bacterium]